MSDILFFARLKMPLSYLNGQKKEESKSIREACNGQLVAVATNSMYGFDDKVSKHNIWPIGGRQDEGTELYIPHEYVHSDISDEEQNIAQALYDSFWQREEYTESIEKILEDVLSCAGPVVKTEKLDENCVRVIHKNKYTSTWSINRLGNFARIIIREHTNTWNSSQRCFNQEMKNCPLPEEILDALCGS